WEKAVLTGTSEAYLRAEQKRHEENTLTAPCDRPCPHPCGVCGAAVFPVTADSGADAESQAAAQEASAPGGFPRSISRHICRYEKTGTAAFLPHLSLMQVMERGLLRAGIALRFTEGFNPKPVLEFAQPSPVGAESLDEVFSFETFNEEASEAASDALNKNLPEGLRITAVSVIRYREKGKKPPSLMSLYTGGRYEIFSDDPELCAKTLSELGRIPAFTIIESSKGRLVVDHACGGNARGFQSLLKAALGDSLKSLRIRKLATRIKTEGI
ncbi:MAG: TIGR03936 family radical SAM-associated protein, partial [Spirochaetales bacterium]|nr:TIGR03936 family radical SAM-associated protein [Spirochaetales bacterium]